jgi:hypothetical protein
MEKDHDTMMQLVHELEDLTASQEDATQPVQTALVIDRPSTGGQGTQGWCRRSRVPPRKTADSRNTTNARDREIVDGLPGCSLLLSQATALRFTLADGPR